MKWLFLGCIILALATTLCGMAKAFDKQDRYDSLFIYYGLEYRIAPELLKAQAIVESRLRPNAIGKHGEKGLAQFVPETWAEWAGDEDPFNPEHAIKAQAAYMRYLFDHFKSERKALAAYNWGMGNVERAIKERGDKWERALPLWTRQYMIKIAHYYVKFQSRKKKAS